MPKRDYKTTIEDNLSALNNLDRVGLSEDFSDSRHLDY